MTEYWKDIVGYEGLYSASNLGNIWNHTFQKYMKYRKCKRNGYYKIGLTKDGKQRTFLMHRLVAIAFIPNPENKREVNHKDLNKLNNVVENLEWVTPMENIDWNRKNDILVRGERNGHALISDKTALWIKNLLIQNPKLNASKLSRETGISRHTISGIKTGKIWKHIKGDINE